MKSLEEISKRITEIVDLTNDRDPKIKDEFRQQVIVDEAVSAADSILMEFSNGTVEELDYLTARVAERFAGKLMMSVKSKFLRNYFGNLTISS